MYNFSDNAKHRIKNGKIVKVYMKFLETDLEEELIIDENNFLKNITFSDERYVPDEGFIGQAVAKEVTGNFYNIDTEFNIQDREFELYIGIELEDNTTEYVKYGTFIVQKPENDNVKDNTSFRALDYMMKFNIPFKVYDSLFPCTLRELLIEICNQANVELDVPTFLNETFIVEDNQFEPGTTLREILKAIAQISFNWARINEENKLVMDFNKNISISETITPDEYFELTTQSQYGELNTIILRNSQAEGENYSIVDEEKSARDGKIELVIEDNPFAYTQEKREILIQEGANLFGLKYIPLYLMDIGYIHLNCKDKIRVIDNNGKTYDTYVLNHNFTYNGVIGNSVIESKAKTLTETKYQFTKELERLYQHTELIVDKANQEIKSIAERQQGDKQEYTEWKQGIDKITGEIATKDDINSLEEKILVDLQGITNTITSNGGNNIFFYALEFWDKIEENSMCLEEYTNTDIKLNSLSGKGYRLNKGISEQKQTVKNDNYTISFLFKKNLTLSNPKININNVEYYLDVNKIDEWKEFDFPVDITTGSIDIKIESDADDSSYITDFMVSIGKEKQIWTQNPNETFTNTVTIGKGIQVDSSESNTFTRIDSDGNRTFNKSTGERVAEMTDKGVYSNEIEVKGKAEIGKLLIQTIEDQVWITGIGG